MKTRAPLYIVLSILWMTNGLLAEAGDGSRLADEIETPDALLQTTDEEKRRTRYGDEDIYISSEGDKENAIVKPDPLERMLDQPGARRRGDGDIRLKFEPEGELADKSIEHPDPILSAPGSAKSGQKQKDRKRSRDRDDELETPDPLLDNMN